MFSRTDIPRKESEEVGEHILTKAVKAGRRTYFFDVRATRGNDYYLTITESRKTTVADGSVVFDRHKIFLYNLKSATIIQYTIKGRFMSR